MFPIECECLNLIPALEMKIECLKNVLLAIIGQRFAERIERNLGRTPNHIIEYGTHDFATHVIITAGFGKVSFFISSNACS